MPIFVRTILSTLTTVSALSANALAQGTAQPQLLQAATQQAGRSASEPYSDITKEVFLSYKDINDFIARSPIATSLAPPELTDIATHGPDVVKVIKGADCNRDGEVDEHVQCVKAFYHLWLKYNR